MRGVVAKQLRGRARGKTSGLPDVAYQSRTHQRTYQHKGETGYYLVNETRLGACTRKIYQRLKVMHAQ